MSKKKTAEQMAKEFKDREDAYYAERMNLAAEIDRTAAETEVAARPRLANEKLAEGEK